MPFPYVWTDQQIEALAKLWAEGRTAREVGKALSFSREAVLGKIKRLGLQRYKNGDEASPQPEEEVPAEPVAIAPIYARREIDVEERDVGPPVFPSVEPILALRPRQCRYPIGDPKRVGFRFCCEPVAVKSYCAEHHKLVWRAAA